jgi:tetratricopeptide (TPR) repeat protein
LHDGRDGEFNRGEFNRFDHFNDFHHHGNFVVAPFWWPLWWPAWWGGGYAGDYYGYGSPYCYYYDNNSYAPVNAENAGIDASVAAADELPYPRQAAESDYSQNGLSLPSSSGGMFFAQAEGAFQAGKYRDALRLANHAAVESPQNPKAAELMSLALFADGDYRSAAAQAHAALSLGPVSSWSVLRGYYGNDVNAYTNQLRALEKYCHDKPTAPEGHFLLAYQYLMTGYAKQAVKQFAEVVKLAPADKLAAELLKQYGGEAPAEEPPPPPLPTAF